MADEKEMAVSEKMFDTFLKLTMHQVQMASVVCFNEEMRKPRYADNDRLLKYGYRVFCQTDEDGILAEIFRRIGTTNKRFIEIGVGDGTQCNTAALLIDGWSGVWIEGYEPSYNLIIDRFKSQFLDRGQLMVIGNAVTMDNINPVIRMAIKEGDVDLLSIDIDGNDYWIWKAITTVMPRVVCIEYNSVLPPPLSLVIPYERERCWDGTNFFGASLEALVKLARGKGYSLVGCNFSGANAFFVRDDLLGKATKPFIEPYTTEEHYEPMRYFAALSIGHKANPSFYEHVP